MDESTIQSLSEETTTADFEEIDKLRSSSDLEFSQEITHESVLKKDVSFSTKGCIKYTKDGGGTIVCCVCAAVKYYSFVKQTKKFGVYSCEPCRKFIRKMIHSKGGDKLKCNKYKGVSRVINPLGYVGLTRLKKEKRCPACWLKTCLSSYKMPDDLSCRLSRKLPVFMTEPSFVPCTLPWRNNVIVGNNKKNIEHNHDTSNRKRSKWIRNISNEPEPCRQKRKAATKFMENISRITGRVTDETLEFKTSPDVECMRKKSTDGMRESLDISKKPTKKEQMKTDQTTQTESEETKTIGTEEESNVGSPSVQDVRRPKLIIFARNIDLSNRSDVRREYAS